MIEILHSLFLGIVQGLTEFLPVSSSAHLNIFPWLFKWEITESFDLALHTGTLLAIVIYFFKDFIDIVVGGYKSVVKKENSLNGRLFWYIVISTIPAGIVGKLLEKVVDTLIDGDLNVEMIVISLALIIMGIVLYVIDKRSSSKITLERMTFKQGFFVGLSQAVAGALPGVSRSGATITTARAFGIDRESAARYSFLLSAPMIAGAVLLSLGEFDFSVSFFVGIFASFVVGLAVIKFLMNFIKKKSYGVFAIYRVIFGFIILVTAIIRMI